MKQLFLVFILQLASVHFYGQVNTKSKNHPKAGAATSDNGPSLKETVEWIAGKINLHSRDVWDEDEAQNKNRPIDSPRIFTIILRDSPCIRLTDDSMFLYCTKRVNFNVINGARTIVTYDYTDDNGESHHVGYYREDHYFPFKEISDVKIVTDSDRYSPDHLHHSLSLVITCTVIGAFLQPNGNFASKWAFNNKYISIAKNSQIRVPMDFSEEKDLPERMIKAFNHLKTFFPKKKEAF